MEGEYCAYIHLSGRQKTCPQLRTELYRSLRVQNQIEVTGHGDGWYSAKFSCQEDYDQAFRRREWKIPGCNSIYYCRWEPNFNFKRVRPLRAGDIVEGGVKFLPREYYRDDVVTEIANAVCGPLGCHVFMVDSSSEGKLPRFLFVYNGSQLPSQIPIYGGATVVGLSYSLAQQCSNCRLYGHIGSTCQAQVYHNPPQPADPPMPLFPDDIGAAFQAGPHQGTPGQTRAQELHEETNSPIRTVAAKNMPAKGAMIVEKGEERNPILYTLSEEVSEIDVSVEVTHLKDRNGNQRLVTIKPHIGDAPKYTKRVLCTSIDGADATRTLEEMCHDKGASLVVVLDKSSVLVNDDQIDARLGFSDSHRAEMTFRKVEANGSVLYVRGNCLLMWKREEVRVSVDTKHSSSQHLKFNASWMIGGVSTPSVEDLGNYPIGDAFSREEHPYQDSTPSTPRSERSYPGPAVYDRSPDIDISSSDHGDTDTEGSSAAFDESPPGSPGSNASYLDYGDSDVDGSSGDERFSVLDWEEDFSTDAEEISCGSSAPSASSSSSSEEN